MTDEQIDILLKAPAPQTGALFTEKTLALISDVSLGERADALLCKPVPEAVLERVGGNFTQGVLDKTVSGKSTTAKAVGFAARVAAWAVAAAACIAVYAGLGNAQNAREAAVTYADYANMAKIADEIADLYALIIQEEFSEIFRL